jgi:ADP-heptose:LPS heptosyltransferase
MQEQLFDLNNIKSVMFVRLGKLGDMMIASWIIKQARKDYPHLKIGLLTRSKSRELFRYNTDIDVLKTWNPAGLPLLALTERLRGWDLLVDLNDEPSRRSVMALKLIKPKHSLAFKNSKSEGVFEKTAVTLEKEKSHVLERLSQPALALGLKIEPGELLPVVYLKPGTIPVKDHIIGLNISAGHPSRYWSPENWEALAKTLLIKFPEFKIMIIHSPADIKLAVALKTQIGLPERTADFKAGGLFDFLTAIASCSILISPDTSAVHAASAFKVPVLGLYPEPYWNFVSWKPSGKNSIAIRSSGRGLDPITWEEARQAALEIMEKEDFNG